MSSQPNQSSDVRVAEGLYQSPLPLPPEQAAAIAHVLKDMRKITARLVINGKENTQGYEDS